MKRGITEANKEISILILCFFNTTNPIKSTIAKAMAINGVLADVKKRKTNIAKDKTVDNTFKGMLLNKNKPYAFKSKIMHKKIPVRFGLLKFKVKPAPLFSPLQVLEKPAMKVIMTSTEMVNDIKIKQDKVFFLNSPVTQR